MEKIFEPENKWTRSFKIIVKHIHSKLYDEEMKEIIDELQRLLENKNIMVSSIRIYKQEING